jgi:putative membrane protein
MLAAGRERRGTIDVGAAPLWSQPSSAHTRRTAVRRVFANPRSGVRFPPMAVYEHDPPPPSRAWLAGIQRFLVFWGLEVIILWVASAILDSVRIDGIEALLLSALVFGVANTVLKPLLLLLTLPITVLTLGLFVPVLNAMILYLVEWVVPGFHVGTFWQTVGAALFISFCSIVLNLIVKGPRVRVTVR